MRHAPLLASPRALGLALALSALALAPRAYAQRGMDGGIGADAGVAPSAPADAGAAQSATVPDAAVSDAAPVTAPAQEPATTEGAASEEAAPLYEHEHDDEGEDEDDHDAGTSSGTVFYGWVRGEYTMRGNTMSAIPLRPLPGDVRGRTNELGQEEWVDQWIRLRGEIGLRPRIKLIGQMDLLDGVVFGDLANGVAPAEEGRDSYSAFPGVDPRWLYIEWLTDIGLVRAGQSGSHWGLGIVANDGDHQPVFGDYRYGDIVERLAFGTKPFGRTSPFTVAIAGDLVFDDIIADIREDETAWQGVLAAFYEKGNRTAGVYGVYRTQTNALDDDLDVLVLDVYAQWDWPEPSGGRLFAALEGAYVHGTTSFARTTERPEQNVRQLMAAAQIGRRSDRVDIVLEGGYASGDSNPEDATQSRATMDPDHRVGLVLFPEVIAWQTARSAALASSTDLFARPARGAELLPTNGGVAGALYLFPYVVWRPRKWLDARFGGVIGRATSDVVDPFAQRAESRNVNYRGGDASLRDLGLELDTSFTMRAEIARGVGVSGGVEGGILFPGRAFDDASGARMHNVGLARLRATLRW